MSAFSKFIKNAGKKVEKTTSKVIKTTSKVIKPVAKPVGKLVDAYVDMAVAPAKMASSLANLPGTLMTCAKWGLIGGGVILGIMAISWLVISSKGQAGEVIREVGGAGSQIMTAATPLVAQVGQTAGTIGKMAATKGMM